MASHLQIHRYTLPDTLRRLQRVSFMILFTSPDALVCSSCRLETALVCGIYLAAVLHVDCDLYSSAITMLRSLGHMLRKGSIVVFDELVNYEGQRYEELCVVILLRTGMTVNC